MKKGDMDPWDTSLYILTLWLSLHKKCGKERGRRWMRNKRKVYKKTCKKISAKKNIRSN
jgi:hypothetical protein